MPVIVSTALAKDVFVARVSRRTTLVTSVPNMVATYVSTYLHKPNHTYFQLWDSTWLALLEAQTVYHDSTPCLHHIFLNMCLAHSGHHDCCCYGVTTWVSDPVYPSNHDTRICGIAPCIWQCTYGNSTTSTIVQPLLNVRRALVHLASAPMNAYSHNTRTFPGRVLDAGYELAKEIT